MSRISKLPHAVQAIRGTVAALRIAHAGVRTYDGHDVLSTFLTTTTMLNSTTFLIAIAIPPIRCITRQSKSVIS